MIYGDFGKHRNIGEFSQTSTSHHPHRNVGTGYALCCIIYGFHV